jgi:hypothetical protein
VLDEFGWPEECRVCGVRDVVPLRFVGYVCERCIWVAERRAGVAGAWEPWRRERRARARSPLLASLPPRLVP